MTQINTLHHAYTVICDARHYRFHYRSGYQLFRLSCLKWRYDGWVIRQCRAIFCGRAGWKEYLSHLLRWPTESVLLGKSLTGRSAGVKKDTQKKRKILERTRSLILFKRTMAIFQRLRGFANVYFTASFRLAVMVLSVRGWRLIVSTSLIRYSSVAHFSLRSSCHIISLIIILFGSLHVCVSEYGLTRTSPPGAFSMPLRTPLLHDANQTLDRQSPLLDTPGVRAQMFEDGRCHP